MVSASFKAVSVNSFIIMRLFKYRFHAAALLQQSYMCLHEYLAHIVYCCIVSLDLDFAFGEPRLAFATSVTAIGTHYYK